MFDFFTSSHNAATFLRNFGQDFTLPVVNVGDDPVTFTAIHKVKVTDASRGKVATSVHIFRVLTSVADQHSLNNKSTFTRNAVTYDISRRADLRNGWTILYGNSD